MYRCNTHVDDLVKKESIRSGTLVSPTLKTKYERENRGPEENDQIQHHLEAGKYTFHSNKVKPQLKEMRKKWNRNN
jgi:hypothetical protein